jgi:pilus assembly protein CpaE
MSARGHFSTDEGNPVMHGEFMAFVSDEESLATVRAWATRQGFSAATAQQGGADMFAQMLEASAPPKMALVDIDGQEDPVATAGRLVSLCGPDCKIIALGSANDVGLYRGMMGAGIVDYLVKPLTAEVLNQAMTAALKGGSGGKLSAKEAKTIIIIGVRGGVGASTIAVNTGWLMAHELRLNIALLDLDLQYGTSSLALDLEPGHGLRDIVSSPHRVDGLMIASSMVTESDQFSVLGAEEAIDEVVPIDNAAITALLKEMRNDFDFILVDLPRHLFAAQKRLLASAHEIVLVTEMSLAGIRDTLRIKTALKNLDCAAPLTIVAARTGPARAGHVDAAAFEKGAQIKIDITIPEDHKTVGEAANSGKSIGALAKHAPVTKAMLALASRLGGKTPGAAHKQNGLMKKLGGMLKGKKPHPKAEVKS